MKKGPLTSDEVRHLEHRWDVLVSFLDVFGDPTFLAAAGHAKEGRIFRGCMDGAIATCRALCERFEVTVKSTAWSAALQPCSSQFKESARTAVPTASDQRCEALWEVLVAANRCVCHLEDKLIDHNVTPERLADAIELVRDMVRARLNEAKLSSAVCK